MQTALKSLLFIVLAGAAAAVAEPIELNEGYRAFVAKRYGTKNSRPPRSVIESRCLEDLESHFSIIHGPPGFADNYYPGVARLLRTHASERSVEPVQRFARICYSICSEEAINEEHGRLRSHYRTIWHELSQTWYRLKIQGMTAEQQMDAIAEGATNDAPFFFEPRHLYLLVDRFAGKINSRLYPVILGERLREDAPLDALLAAIGPTQEQLLKMLYNGDARRRQAAKLSIALNYPESEDGQKANVADLLSNDGHRALHALTPLSKYIGSRASSRTRQYIFKTVDKRLRDLQAIHLRGADGESATEESVPPAVFQMIFNWLTAMHDENESYFLQKEEQLRHHLDWYQSQVEDPRHKGRAQTLEDLYKPAVRAMK